MVIGKPDQPKHHFHAKDCKLYKYIINTFIFTDIEIYLCS